MSERQLGPFLIKEKLGGGGMGVVYRATYTKTGHEVALKLLHADQAAEPRLIARFERELEILKKLKHPHIVPCYGGGKFGAQRFLAMELIEGGSLHTELVRRRTLPWQEVVRIGMQVCDALEHAHERGIIHRDLKPSNLLLTKSGQLKLADFGIARDTDATGLTATGRTVGTFAYMAPEQIRGFPPVTHKTDLYSLGCVLYELLSGRPPFEGQSAPEVMYAHVEKTPPRVTTIALDCPVWFDALIGQLLEKDPEKRPRDAAMVRQALQEIEDRVREQASMTSHAVSGSPTALGATADVQQVRKLLKPKKKKKRAAGPFHEQTWFLSLCLALLLSFVAWALWPASEEALYAGARPLMESDDPIDWDRAQTRYLRKMQERYPHGKYAEQRQQWFDKIEMHKAEERLKNKLRLGLDLDTEGERLYALARRYEQFGDRVTALEKYASLKNLLADRQEARVYVNLAQRQIARISAEGDEPADRVAIVQSALERAESVYAQGNVLAARETWQSIVALYADNQELRPLVKRARARLQNRLDEDEPAE
jgi:serine/threonine protein kinase